MSRSLTIFLMLLPAQLAMAQEETDIGVVQDSNGDRSAARAAAGAMEEVIVTGQRSLGSLIREGATLTEQFYDRFNAVIDNPDFRIDCRSEYPTGSNIPTRVCRTGYQDRLLNQQAASIIRGLGSTDQDRLFVSGQALMIQPQLAQLQREFAEVMLAAVNFDPVLNEQIIRLMSLRSAVENFESRSDRRRREREQRRAVETE